MRKILKVIAIILFLGIVVLQFFRPDRTNPPIVKAETLEATTNLPDDINSILKRSCNDCHSNTTAYPWYSNIAPISWSVVEHIDHGRGELNFSKWATYPDSKKMRKLEEVCDQVKAGEMPHNQYLWIHWNAVLSENDKKSLCDWTIKESEKIKTMPNGETISLKLTSKN